VTVCERFNLPTAESDYEECGAFHGPQRNAAWLAQWTPSNPKSPINVYKDGTVLRAQVKAVSFFARGNGVRDLAQVRYAIGRRAAGSSVEQLKDYIASIQFAYAKPADDARLRQWNPLGFKILTFEPVPEVLPDPAAPNPMSTSAIAAMRATP
jgi:type IV secretion system protein VirB8